MDTVPEQRKALVLDTASGRVAEPQVAMGESAKQLRSVYEQFLEQPDTVVAEIINGTLVTSPRPATPHAHAASALGIVLGGPFFLGQGGPGGWLILDEPELQLSEHILVPDLAAWRRERMPEMPIAPRLELAPDWICEVLSPSTQAIDRADKLPIYASHGVRHAWLIEPLGQTLEVYRLEGERWLLLGTHRGPVTVRAEPFDAVDLDLSALWIR
jgi:Uma2 family endonuclease